MRNFDHFAEVVSPVHIVAPATVGMMKAAHSHNAVATLEVVKAYSAAVTMYTRT